MSGGRSGGYAWVREVWVDGSHINQLPPPTPLSAEQRAEIERLGLSMRYHLHPAPERVAYLEVIMDQFS